MATPWKDRAAIEAAFGRLPGPRRLAMAEELLRWTVANFTTPIADPTTRELVERAATAVRAAVAEGASITTAEPGFLDEIDDAMQEQAEPGGFDLLISYFLCFDELGPEITPNRLFSLFDHCYQSDYRRYSEASIAVGEVDVTPRGQAILDYQRDLIQRYTG